MTATLHLFEKKWDTLTDSLAKVYKTKKYYLFICTCYFNTEIAEKFIEDLISREIHIRKVFIFVDRKEAIQIGIDEFNNLTSKFSDLSLDIKAIDVNGLFHSKIYALINIKNDVAVNGSLTITSANLTNAGIVKKTNVESFITVYDKAILNELIQQMEGLKPKFVEIDQLNNYKSSNSLSFRFNLLGRGEFLHKWNAHLRQFLEIRYDLNDEMQTLKPQILSDLGFDSDASSVGRCYFNLNNIPIQTLPRGFTKKYGIETTLGYWIPKTLWKNSIENSDFDVFKDTLFSEINKQLKDVCLQMESDYKELLRIGIIKHRAEIPTDRIISKIKLAQTNPNVLLKYFTQYEPVESPIDLSQIQKINNTFNELKFRIECSKRKNVTMKAFLNAVDNKSIEAFEASLQSDIKLDEDD